MCPLSCFHFPKPARVRYKSSRQQHVGPPVRYGATGAPPVHGGSPCLCVRCSWLQVRSPCIRSNSCQTFPRFYAVLDGHGGPEAAAYVRERLWPILQGHPGFVSENAEDVADAIRESFALVHDEMKKQALPTWPIRPDGHPSTAGTTVSVLLIRAKRYWIANVGDSRVVVSKGSRAVELTTDHRLTNERERASLERRGGMVVKSSQGGILRVVWQRTVLNNPRMIERLPGGL